jgi:hypothetical protein
VECGAEVMDGGEGGRKLGDRVGHVGGGGADAAGELGRVTVCGRRRSALPWFRRAAIRSRRSEAG